MTLVTAHLDLDLAALPHSSEQLGARFDRQPNANGEPMLLMYPFRTSAATDHLRYATGMRLACVDRAEGGSPVQAGRMGQLIVTPDRVLGMFVQGSAAGQIVDDTEGSIFAFGCDYDDVASAEVTTNWRGKPVEVFLNSSPGQAVPFRLHVFSVVAELRDDGGHLVTDLADLLGRLTSDGRDGLRRLRAHASSSLTPHPMKE